MFKKFLCVALLFTITACSHKGSHNLKKITKGDHRSKKNKTRDNYRNPIDTLKFFDIKPDMKVVEVSPGGGWYTEILGPLLREKGELYLAIFSDKSKRSYAPKLNAKIKKMTGNKKLYGKVFFSKMETPDAIGPVAPNGSVDRVLTFRNVHNWMKDGKAKQAFMSFYKALKPGGVLGIVEHRANNKQKQDPKAKNGYVREDYMIDLALSVGFEFVAKSEINANYHDTANHPKGVWTLPPSLRLKDKDLSKYLAIGESDRMTLKFVKPLK